MSIYKVGRAEVTRIFNSGIMKAYLDRRIYEGRIVTKADCETGLVSPILAGAEPKPGHVLCPGKNGGYIPVEALGHMIFKADSDEPGKESYFVLSLADFGKTMVALPTFIQGLWSPYKFTKTFWATQIMNAFSCDQGIESAPGSIGDWLIYDKENSNWFPCTHEDFVKNYVTKEE